MLLVTIVVMAYVLSLQEVFQHGSTKEKVYRDGSRVLAQSFFRQAITCLRRHAQSLITFIHYLEEVTRALFDFKWLYVQ